MKQDQVFGAVLIAFSVFMYIKAEQLPPPMFGALGADVFPKILFVLLASMGAVLTGQSLWKQAKRPRLESPPAEVSAETYFRRYRYVYMGFFFFLGYVVIMYYLGYLIATLIYLPAFMWVLGPRTLKSAAVIGVISFVLTFGLQYAFIYLLKVYLPEGSLF